MNSRMQDYVSPVDKSTEHNKHNADIILPDFEIETCSNGFCDGNRTLTFSNNKLYNPSLLPDNTTSQSATTHAMITTSLSFTEHQDIVYYINKNNLAKLYHVTDNPEVLFDTVSEQYIVERYHYIDRETMTGIVIRDNLESVYCDVVGIFAPRGYDKVKAYNNFAKQYLITRNQRNFEVSLTQQLI